MASTRWSAAASRWPSWSRTGWRPPAGCRAKLEYAGASGSRRSTRRIRYAYQDAAGRTHTHTSMITSDFWNAHVEGGPITIVYSRSRPQVSAPRHLVELSRQALAKRKA
jgi:hypothetical protein